MKKERYIIDEREVELLERYEGTMAQKNDPYRYDTFNKETLADFCKIKDRSNDIYYKRFQAAREVIDLIAKQVGINPENTSYWLYALEVDGTTPIVKRMEEWFSRRGEKAQLKRRLQELEQENSYLKSLINISGGK